MSTLSGRMQTADEHTEPALLVDNELFEQSVGRQSNAHRLF